MVREKLGQPLYVSIARGCLGWKQSGLLAFLTYFDASGDDIDPRAKVVSVGGFIAPEQVWSVYETRWAELLKEFGLTSFHMKEYTWCSGEFSPWKGDEDKRKAFMVALTKIIRELNMVAIGASIPLSVYRLANRSHCVEEVVGTPYTVAAMMALANAYEWRSASANSSEPILVFVERGDNRQSDYRRKLRKIIWDEEISEPIIIPKKNRNPDGTIRHVLPFQSADFIAYEQAKALTDLIVHRKTRLRQSLANALPPSGEQRTYWALLIAEARDQIFARFRIPRRYSHFDADATRGQRLLGIDPLCFVNGQPVASYIKAGGYLHPEWPFAEVP
jgi:hypothetical protein